MMLTSHIPRVIVLAVLAAGLVDGVAAVPGHPTRQARRERALWQLRGCCRTPRTRACEDESGRYLVGLARRGDDGVIGPMMEVATCGDPAIGDVLAPYLRELLTTDPKRFVRIVAGRAEAKQYEVVFAAVMHGGTGIDPETTASVRRVLRRLAKEHGRIGQAALRCLSEFDRTTGGASP